MRRFTVLLAIAWTLSVAGAARADVTPPDVGACQGKTAGAACTMTEGSGACAAGRCSRLDYGSWNRDASSSPPTTEYDCVKCVVGAKPTTTADDSSGGCSIAMRRVGPWGLAVVPAVVLSLIGRRRRRS